MTLETVIVLPLFLAVVLTMCRLFIFSAEVYRMERGLFETALKESVYAGAVENLLPSNAIGELRDEILGEDVFVVSDSRTFELLPSFRGSTVAKLLGINADTGITVRKTLRFRLFTGHSVASLFEEAEQGSSEEKQVYVTETGTVYHLSAQCSSLKISARPVASAYISRERNSGGAKYYACERCASGELPSTVYVTSDGTRYHYSTQCPSLKRSVSTIPASQTGNRRPCSRCAASEKQ